MRCMSGAALDKFSSSMTTGACINNFPNQQRPYFCLSQQFQQQQIQQL